LSDIALGPQNGSVQRSANRRPMASAALGGLGAEASHRLPSWRLLSDEHPVGVAAGLPLSRGSAWDSGQLFASAAVGGAGVGGRNPRPRHLRSLKNSRFAQHLCRQTRLSGRIATRVAERSLLWMW